MPAAPGTRFGPYEILSPLGAGGMGEVYRARDSRLGRDVALKLLPSTGDRARFETEARAIAALNHPNIVAIHDVGENYIVTELVDGTPLLGPIENPRRILDIAVQIADGLASAHAAGILHRDVKPGNILLTRDNRIKILDFGLAKSFAPLGPDEHTMTASGMILGTVAYMSPEQARGSALDHRSDQFSLGLVLHELITGRRAFDRATKAETLTALIREEAEPLPSTTPAALRWIVERCLFKDPADRYQSTRDLYLELRHQRDNPASLATPASGTALPRRKFAWLAVAGAAVAAALLTAVVLRRPATQESIRLTPFAVERAEEGWPAFSPDGHSIAWVRNSNEILVRAIDSLAPVSLIRSPGHLGPPLWTADGRRVCYIDRGDLWCLSAAGGTPSRLLAGVDAVAFTPDGKSVVTLLPTTSHPRLAISSPPGAALQPLPGIEVPAAVNDLLAFSPDGRQLALITPDQDIWLAPWPAGTPRQLSFRGLASWFPDSRHMAVTRRQSSGANTLSIADTQSGPMRELLRDSNAYVGASVSPAGDRIVYTTGLYDFDVFEYSIDGNPVRPFADSVRTETGASFSPSGDSVLYWSDVAGSMSLWTRRSDGSAPALIVDPGPDNRNPGEARFSSDGRRIAFTLPTAATGIEVIAASGGQRVRVASSQTPVSGLCWSSDGTAIWYATAGKLWKVAADGGAPVAVKESATRALDSSSDGRWIAYLSTDGVHLLTPDGKSDRLLHAERAPLRAQFATGNQKLYLIRPGLANVSTLDVETGAESAPVKFSVEVSATATVNSIHPNGKTVLVSAGGRHYNLWLASGFAPPRLSPS